MQIAGQKCYGFYAWRMVCGALCLFMVLLTAGQVQGQGVFVEMQEITLAGAVPRDEFGEGVALDDGRAVLWGIGPRVYEKDVDGVWQLTENLTDLPEQLIGSSAIDGDTIVTGAWLDWYEYAYVAEYDSANGWRRIYAFAPDDPKPIYDTYSYRPVDISGDAFITGTWSWAYNGDVYIVERDDLGQWNTVTNIAENPLRYIGDGVAIHGNLAVATGDDTSLVVFERQGPGQWNTIADIVHDGFHVEIHDDSRNLDMTGEVIAMGLPFEDRYGEQAGAVVIYQPNALGQWEQAVITAPVDITPGDRFGTSVSVAGDLLLVGAPYADGLEENSGAVYVYQRDAEDNWIEIDKLVGSNPDAEDRFGSVVSLDVYDDPAAPGGIGYQAMIAAPNQNYREFLCLRGFVYTACGADFNTDGYVGLLDLDILGQNWGATGLNTWDSYLYGDANQDGEVGLLDLDILGQDWEGLHNPQLSGQVGSVYYFTMSSAIPAPEPGVLGLVLIGAAVGLVRRR